MTSWITLYPYWYIRERNLLARHYPGFQVDERQLRAGKLILYGELIVRPPGGARRYPILLDYPQGTPFEHPYVTPIVSLPEWGSDGGIVDQPKAKLLDCRHQMPKGNLCLFQREPRTTPGGDVLRGVDILRRAGKYFTGYHTGRWPPDTVESELESHFACVNDVLVEDTFYHPDLDRGHGRLFFAWDLRRFHEIPQPTLCPMILTSLTEESGFIRPFDARRELSRIYPWIEDDLWDAEKLMRAPDLGEVDAKRLEHGYWWSLSVEPQPFHDCVGLLKLLSSVAENGDSWEMLKDQLGGDLTSADKHYFGVRYPARGGGFEWLVLVVPRNPKKEAGGTVMYPSDRRKREAFENSPVFGIRVHRVCPTALRLRNTGVVHYTIEDKTVALIGLGALGSEVAELLAKAGVGHFRLCDSDHLAVGNVARHVGGISDFGSLKTRVVASRLLEINPYLEFGETDIIDHSATASLDCLAQFMASADLTICTTADESAESVINQIAVIHRKTVLYGRSLRRATIGRVFLVRPGRDACKSCLAEFAESGRGGAKTPEDWIDVKEDEEGVLLHECGRPVIAGSAIDLSFLAGLIARVGLDVLEGKAGDFNHWLWSRLPAGDVDRRLVSAMSTFVGRLQTRPGCPACQEPDVLELVMIDEVRDAIVNQTESSPDAETGGVLIGFVDVGNRAVAIRATGPGPNATRTRMIFRRDVEYVQGELDRAAAELGMRGMYVGEWHSHLSPSPQPSALDIDSLFGVSRAPNYLTRCPVMVISGLDPATGKVASLNSWVFPVGGRTYNVPNQVTNPEVIATYRERADMKVERLRKGIADAQG